MESKHTTTTPSVTKQLLKKEMEENWAGSKDDDSL
jgi:hypothetical protein